MNPPEILDAAAVLAAAESTVRERRQAQVDDLRLVLAWADLHGDDPQQVPGAVPARFGGDRLVEVGGDGTPWVQDLCLGELAIARQAHVLSTRTVMADALDLRHRLPLTWAKVQDLACETWVACRVASMSRSLDRHRVAVVDAAVAAAVACAPGRHRVAVVDAAVAAAVACAPGRVLRIAEAKIIEADTAAHAERVAEQRRKRGVVLTPADEHGLRVLIARLETADAVWVDAMVDRVADLLATDEDLRATHHPDLPDDVGKDELRAVALGWLARPHDLAELLGILDTAETSETSETSDADRARRRPSAVLHVHLHQAALDAGVGVTRVEELGPLLLDQVARLLGHAHVTLRPVLDLAGSVAVDAYEHPTSVRDRTAVLVPADAFPHSTSLTRRVDLDHAVPYDPGGPPGQTGDHNVAPLARRHHRAKTHLGYTVDQLDRATYLWTTPHGLQRLVDHAGTHLVDGPVRRAPSRSAD